jgi:hypothetical protein
MQSNVLFGPTMKAFREGIPHLKDVAGLHSNTAIGSRCLAANPRRIVEAPFETVIG